MKTLQPKQISLPQWDARYKAMKKGGLKEPSYGGTLGRHLEGGDTRLARLMFDDSAAALNLWNFLMTERTRLIEAKAKGNKLVATMKDLGTIPVMAYSFPNLTAFYPDGAWWIPCFMELNSATLKAADSLGLDESFCPVRAMLGAFATESHFPKPDLITCSVGATCDDFSSIAQFLNGMGYPISWWEIPHRRIPEKGEQTVLLPGGIQAPAGQAAFIETELKRIKSILEETAGMHLTDGMLSQGIRTTNKVRSLLQEIRQKTFTAPLCPLPALEHLICEMLAIHFCSDQLESIKILSGILSEIDRRIKSNMGFFSSKAVKVFWVNPVADIKVMNLLERCGGRICGTEYLFTHAIDLIPEDLPPMEALARTALADPMAGTSGQRAKRIAQDIKSFGAEALIISKIPGASHCALEGTIIMDSIKKNLDIPVLEIEVPPVSDGMGSSLRNRIDALIEVSLNRRRKS